MNIFFSPLGGLKLTIQPDGSSWWSLLHSFWFYHTHTYLGSLNSILIKHHHWMAIKGHHYGTKGCGCACCGYFTITWMRIRNKQDTQRPSCSNVGNKNLLYTFNLFSQKCCCLSARWNVEKWKLSFTHSNFVSNLH